MEIKIVKTVNPKEKPEEDSLIFGVEFTDYMFEMDYTEGIGWHDAVIKPYGPIEIMPSAMVLHYAQEVFEGLKAYKTPSGEVQLFRPDENFKRMNRSNARMCIPFFIRFSQHCVINFRVIKLLPCLFVLLFVKK